MINVFESLLPVFLIISLGFSLRKSGLIQQNLWQGMEILAYWVLFPALLADTLIHAQFADIPLLKFITTLLTPVLIISAVLIATQTILYKNQSIRAPEYTTIFQTSIRWNAFIALAIATRLSGDTGTALVAAAMAVLVPIVNLIVVTIFAINTQNQSTKHHIRNTLLTTITNPFIVASLIGILINATDITIYQPILTALNVIGKSALGIALLIVGAGLSAKAVKNTSAALWIGTVNKLLILPIITIILCISLNITGETLKIAIICAAVPTAMNGYILAKQMGGNAELYAATVTIQTLISVLSIPILIQITQYIFPNIM